MEFEKLRDMLVETLGCEPDCVTPEASLVDDLDADSLASMELVMALEEATGLHIEDEETAKFKTVQDILDYVSANLA